MSLRQLGFVWPMSSRTGWGVFGLNLALQLAARRISAIPFLEPLDLDLNAVQQAAVEPALRLGREAASLLPPEPDRVFACPFPVLHALGNGFTTTSVSRKIEGSPDIGMVFMEDAKVTDEIRRRAERYRLILAGSGWNAEILRAGGIENVRACPQGVDINLFDPDGPARNFGGRFTIFSGGKLEYRKGQDIVIAAFRRLLEHDPDALLAAAWHNYWPDPEPWPSPHIEGLPETGADRRLRLAEWVAANGIPERNFLDLGAPANAEMASILRGASAGLFPNRAEGGTNLVAMEALAAGLPSVLSANTGHLDLIRDGVCIPLETQGPCRPFGTFGSVEGWGESDPEEVAAALIRLRDDREAAEIMGRKASRMMEQWSWGERVDAIVEAVEGVM
jgi:glycosyltransferase involved in cell wall biosynthesis